MPKLKQILALDAASCALFFAAGAGAAATIAPLLGLPTGVVAAAGWICLPAAILLAIAASRPAKPLVGAIVGMNAGWVAASLVVWLTYFSQLTALGHAVIVAQAIAVEMFVMLEWRGLKFLSGEPLVA